VAILQAQLQAVLHQEKSIAANASSNNMELHHHVVTQSQQQQAHGYYHRQVAADPNGLVPLNMGPIFGNAVNRLVESRVVLRNYQLVFIQCKSKDVSFPFPPCVWRRIQTKP